MGTLHSLASLIWEGTCCTSSRLDSSLVACASLNTHQKSTLSPNHSPSISDKPAAVFLLMRSSAAPLAPTSEKMPQWVTLVSGNASRRTDVGVGEQQCWCRGTAMLVSGNMYVGVGRRAFMSGYIHFAHFLHFTHFVHFTHCLCTFCALFTHFIQFRHFVHCSHFDMARMHRRIF